MWLPDVAIVTADSFYQLPKSDSYPLRLRSTGYVDFAPGGIIRFQCKMDLTIFPFDSMKCLARIESWFLAADKQIFDKEKSSFSLLNFTDHVQWHLDDYNMKCEDVYYPISGLTYGAINFEIILTRKSTYYLMNVIVPSFMLSLLELVTFLLPENQVIRIQVSVLLLLAYTMFLAIIQADLPRSSDQTPLLTIYITLMILYIAVAITFQCFVMMLINKANLGSSIPKKLLYWLKKTHVGLSGILPMQSSAKSENDQTEIKGIQHKMTTEPEVKTSQLSRQRSNNAKFWKRLYGLVDKVGGIVYTILILATTVILLMIAPSLYH